MSRMIRIEVAGMEEGLLINPEGGSIDNVTWNPLWVRSDLIDVIEPDKKHPETCTIVFKNKQTPVWAKPSAEQLAILASD